MASFSDLMMRRGGGANWGQTPTMPNPVSGFTPGPAQTWGGGGFDSIRALLDRLTGAGGRGADMGRGGELPLGAAGGGASPWGAGLTPWAGAGAMPMRDRGAMPPLQFGPGGSPGSLPVQTGTMMDPRNNMQLAPGVSSGQMPGRMDWQMGLRNPRPMPLQPMAMTPQRMGRGGYGRY